MQDNKTGLNFKGIFSMKIAVFHSIKDVGFLLEGEFIPPLLPHLLPQKTPLAAFR